MTTNPTATVLECTRDEDFVCVQAQAGKTRATVVINSFEVRVICENASHRVWRGSGRAFSTVTEARDAYKSPEMKAIISAADALNA